MSVRHATADDYPALIAFGRKFFDSLAYADITYCEASAARWLDIMRAHGVLLISEVDDEPVGMAGGIYSPFIFNDSHKVGAEVMWWVEPEYRRNGIGSEMLQALEDAAEREGLIRWSMMAIEDSAEQVGKIYREAGYTPAERTYVKVPKWLQ